MFLKRTQSKGKQDVYWELVESYRTARGPRQRTVAYLGALTSEELESVQAGSPRRKQTGSLFGPCAATTSSSEAAAPQWAEIDTAGVRVERSRDFGGAWLGLEVLKQLELDTLLARLLPDGKEDVGWDVMAQVLVLCRLCEPSSELQIAAHLYARSGLEDLLGVPVSKVNDDRLYRALDKLLLHKDALEAHLKARLGELFELDYDLLLYDSTSTYFEGQCDANPQAQRGYSRDQRPDCRQVCIALVVSRCGMPLCYEVFAGNRADVTTTEHMVNKVEARYGKANRVWVMDRGMVSKERIAFLREDGRRYIVGAAKSYLKRFAADLVNPDGWQRLLNGVEVKLCAAPDETDERFIVCRSPGREAKEKAMHDRAQEKMEAGLQAMAAACVKRNYTTAVINQRVGRLKARCSRAAALFRVTVTPRQPGSPKAGVEVTWTTHQERLDWNRRSEGCYLLRTNIIDWTAQELWQAYIQLTEAEAAFRIHKQDLSLRPVWHQKQDRVQAHILVCFLAYVLWKTLGQMCRLAGLGDEPRRVLDEIKQIRLVDVLMPTKGGPTLRKRCVTRPSPEQAILLHRLKLKLPKSLDHCKNVVEKIEPLPSKHAHLSL